MASKDKSAIDTFDEAYHYGAKDSTAYRLKEAVGDFMPMGPGKNFGDASGKMAYEPGTPGGESKGTRSGGGVTQGFSKGDVKAGAPWDTKAHDSARRLSMSCRDCGEKNYMFEAARAFKCHECGSITKMRMRSRATEAFDKSYYDSETDMHRQVREASRVADGMDHDEEADSRRGASDDYPVDDGDPDDPRAAGWNGPAQDDDDDEDMDEVGDAGTGDGSMGGVGGSRMSPGMDVTSEDEESAPKMRASFKCKQCSEKVMHPMRLARTSEDEVVQPVKAKCSKGHVSNVSPVPGYKWTNKASEAEAVKTFFTRYFRETHGSYLA